MDKTETVEIRISGRVQGVGFRYFTQRLALTYYISGWVKNMPDGSVLLQASGQPADMNMFRQKLRQGPSFSQVDDLVALPLPQTEAHLGDFRISYY